MKSQYDVIIIGGGPAGAVLGTYLSKANIDCVIFEKEKFPRPHVGESLVASSTLIFKELGLIKKMAEAGFQKKYGAIWTTEKSNKIHGHDWEDLGEDYQMQIDFSERKLKGVDQNYTYHVDRAKFDSILLNHAQEFGCHVYEEHQVFSSDINNENVTISVRDNEKNEYNINAKIVVDASGRNTFFGNKLNLKIKDPVFNQVSIHTWFKNYKRTPKEEDNNTIHFLPIANSWIWQIPINNEITSIGIVAQKEHFSNDKKPLETIFWEMVKTRPKIYERLNSAEQINPFKIDGDYSYAMKELTNNRLLLIGDAARFVDPIFSSGVSIAMQSAKFASIDIIKAVKQNKFDKTQFSAYEKIITRGCKNWHEFITLYYRLNVMFTYFLGKPEHRIEVLKFLQGDVYDEDKPPFLGVMRTFVEDVENNPKHPLHDYLGNLTANKFAK